MQLSGSCPQALTLIVSPSSGGSEIGRPNAQGLVQNLYNRLTFALVRYNYLEGYAFAFPLWRVFAPLAHGKLRLPVEQQTPGIDAFAPP